MIKPEDEPTPVKANPIEPMNENTKRKRHSRPVDMITYLSRRRNYIQLRIAKSRDIIAEGEKALKEIDEQILNKLKS